MARIVARWPWVLPLLTFIVATMSGLAVAAALPGCGASTQQRIVSGMASVAVAADEANATVYESIGRKALDRVERNGGTLRDWCLVMVPHWQRASEAECAAEALADLAEAGQAAVDSGGELNREWAGMACGVLKAMEAIWQGVEETPQALQSVRAAVCSFAGVDRPWEPECSPRNAPPGCEGVL